MNMFLRLRHLQIYTHTYWYTYICTYTGLSELKEMQRIIDECVPEVEALGKLVLELKEYVRKCTEDVKVCMYPWCACMCLNVYVCMCVCMYLDVYVCILMCMYVCILMYTYQGIYLSGR